jgi:hypothetical protein
MKHKERGNFRLEHTFVYVRTKIADTTGACMRLDSPEIAATNMPLDATIFPFWLHLLVPAVLTYHLYAPFLGNCVDFAKMKISL